MGKCYIPLPIIAASLTGCSPRRLSFLYTKKHLNTSRCLNLALQCVVIALFPNPISRCLGVVAARLEPVHRWQSVFPSAA
jgi:hypothetical protein